MRDSEVIAAADEHGTGHGVDRDAAFPTLTIGPLLREWGEG